MEPSRLVMSRKFQDGYKVWFWPKQDSVEGFLGTSPVIVAGLNPSLGRPPRRSREKKKSDDFFYGCLRKEGLANAHITDLIKIRATRSDTPPLFYNPRISRLHRRYFRKEVTIIKPAVLVALGRNALEVLRGWSLVVPEGERQWVLKASEERKIPVILTVHPAATVYRKTTEERRRRFREDIRKAHQLLSSLPGA